MKLYFASFFVAFALQSAQADSLADDGLARVAAPGAKVELLASGFGYVEGPAWNPRGFWVLSDIPGDTLHKITPAGKVEPIRKPTSHSNGNAYDGTGRLVSGEHAPARRLARKLPNGIFDTLADRYNGKRLNSPNDMAIKSDGSIYFTDPTYGVEKADEELGFRGLYRYFPSGRLELLDNTWTQPNGLCFSPDERTLYVGDSQEGKIFRFDVDKNGVLSAKTLLATIPKPGDPDGMKCDQNGTLFLAAPGGVWIFAPRGGLLGVIALPKNASNLAFGGADGKTLLITAGDSVYSVKLKVGAKVGSKVGAKVGRAR